MKRLVSLISVVSHLSVGLLVLSVVSCTKGGGGGDEVVAEFSGQKVRASEAFGGIKTRLFELEEEMFKTKEQAIQEYVDQKLLETESKKAGVPADALLDKETGGDSGPVSDADIEGFLTGKGLSLKDPRIKKDDVREYLKYRKRFEKRQAFLGKLRQSAQVKILLKEPQSPKLQANTEGFPTWGNAKAPVTILEFSDYQCPFCSRAVPTLDRIKKEYGPDKVKIVFRDMPLPNHPRAIPAALAAHCSNDQGKFWEMHDMLFNSQGKLEDKDLKEYAKKLSLDEKKFAECYESKRHQASIDRSRKEAEMLGIQATPSFIINGALLQGAQPFEKFKEKIDRAISKG